MLVSFSNVITCSNIIKVAKNLRSSSNPLFTNVFINPDLTHEQRAEQKRLNYERKLRKENDEDVIIRNDKVILRPAQFIHDSDRLDYCLITIIITAWFTYFQMLQCSFNLKNKLHELGILSTANFDFIAITETWLNNDFPNSAISAHIPNYSIYRSDRVDRCAGSALLLTRPSLHVESLSNIFVNKPFDAHN